MRNGNRCEKLQKSDGSDPTRWLACCPLDFSPAGRCWTSAAPGAVSAGANTVSTVTNQNTPCCVLGKFRPWCRLEKYD